MTKRLTQGREAIRNLNLTDLAFLAMVTSIMALYDLKRLAVIMQGVFLLCMGVELLKRRTPLFKNRFSTVFVISYAAFFLWAALSFLWAEHKSTFVQMLISIAQVSAIGIGTAYYINSRERLRFVFIALAFAALVFCARFLLDVPAALWGQRVRIGGILSYGSNRGAVMLSFLSLVLVSFAITRRKWFLSLPVAMFMFIALLFGTRSVLVFLFVGTFVLLVAFAMTMKQFVYSAIGLLIVTGVVLLLIMNVNILYNSIGRRIIGMNEVLTERVFVNAIKDEIDPVVEAPAAEESQSTTQATALFSAESEYQLQTQAEEQNQINAQPTPMLARENQLQTQAEEQNQTNAQPTTMLARRESISSASQRLDLILMAIDAFLSAPIHGVGLDGFRFISAPRFTYAHCNQLELLATLGLVGFVLYYWFQAYMVLWAWKRRREDHLYLLVIAFLVALFVSDVFLITYNSERDHVYMGIFVGIMCLNAKGGAESPSERQPAITIR